MGPPRSPRVQTGVTNRSSATTPRLLEDVLASRGSSRGSQSRATSRGASRAASRGSPRSGAGTPRAPGTPRPPSSSATAAASARSRAASRGSPRSGAGTPRAPEIPGPPSSSATAAASARSRATSRGSPRSAARTPRSAAGTPRAPEAASARSSVSASSAQRPGRRVVAPKIPDAPDAPEDNRRVVAPKIPDAPEDNRPGQDNEDDVYRHLRDSFANKPSLHAVLKVFQAEDAASPACNVMTEAQFLAGLRRLNLGVPEARLRRVARATPREPDGRIRLTRWLAALREEGAQSAYVDPMYRERLAAEQRLAGRSKARGDVFEMLTSGAAGGFLSSAADKQAAVDPYAHSAEDCLALLQDTTGERKIRMAFKHIMGVNYSPRIPRQQFQHALGTLHTIMTPGNCQRVVELLDPDESGEVDFRAFIRAYRRRRPGDEAVASVAHAAPPPNARHGGDDYHELARGDNAAFLAGLRETPAVADAMPTERHQVRKLFLDLDTDHDDFVSRADLERALRARAPALGEEQLRRVVELCDLNGDGYVQFPGLLGVCSKLAPRVHIIDSAKEDVLRVARATPPPSSPRAAKARLRSQREAAVAAAAAAARSWRDIQAGLHSHVAVIAGRFSRTPRPDTFHTVQPDQASAMFGRQPNKAELSSRSFGDSHCRGDDRIAARERAITRRAKQLAAAEQAVLTQHAEEDARVARIDSARVESLRLQRNHYLERIALRDPPVTTKTRNVNAKHLATQWSISMVS